jgi:hypothetical protein
MEKMTLISADTRPDCDKILKEKSLWAMTLDKLLQETNIQDQLEFFCSNIDQNFHCFFIQNKLQQKYSQNGAYKDPYTQGYYLQQQPYQYYSEEQQVYDKFDSILKVIFKSNLTKRILNLFINFLFLIFLL